MFPENSQANGPSRLGSRDKDAPAMLAMEENHPRPRMPEQAAERLTIEFAPGRPGIGGLLQFRQLSLEAARGLIGRLAQALQPLELSDLLGLKVGILRHTGNITADFDDVVLQQAQAFACLKLS